MTPTPVAVAGRPSHTSGAVGRFAVARKRLMGTDVTVVCAGEGPGPWQLLARIDELERLWSRFRDDSELTRLGALDGRPAVVGAETADLVERCFYGWRVTDGLFDPTVIASLEALGYDRDLSVVDGSGTEPERCVPAPGLLGTFVDRSTGLVRLPPGVRIDPGGIGKGLAADLVAVEAVASAGTDFGVLVSVGGDLRTAGRTPPGGWTVEIDHLVGVPMQLVVGSETAIATSSVLRRRWTGRNGTFHHAIDPRTGRPAGGHAVSVSVVADEAWWAEILATALLVDTDAFEHLDGVDRILDGVDALVTLDDGSRRSIGQTLRAPSGTRWSPGHPGLQ